ncbi:UDP-N-acetylmuramoyl-tripeptide--D-alanyl-D-alanine ligase, partial [Candidatus Desantisbacteria bacterium]|nr:UDP-N-acetylmuramoyl-tripeptide--D-alanyl-D-alanine ligase [Candidatus Desantisbacteria bacterium]
FEGLWIINDAYNANPVSMLNALETFSEIETNKQRILILGDMLELGEKEVIFHKEIGKHAAKKNINYLFTCGTLAAYIAESAIEAGMPKARIFICNLAEEIVPKLKKILSGNDFILFKGSRAMKMEKIIEFLKGKSNE